MVNINTALAAIGSIIIGSVTNYGSAVTSGSTTKWVFTKDFRLGGTPPVKMHLTVVPNITIDPVTLGAGSYVDQQDLILRAQVYARNGVRYQTDTGSFDDDGNTATQSFCYQIVDNVRQVLKYHEITELQAYTPLHLSEISAVEQVTEGSFQGYTCYADINIRWFNR